MLYEAETINNAIKAIHVARTWDGVDWTHERTDLDGKQVKDEAGDPVYCDGDYPQVCGYCRDAEADATAAAQLADDAITSLQSGDFAAALDAIRAAAAYEHNWGDAPLYRPAVEAVEAVITGTVYYVLAERAVVDAWQLNEGRPEPLVEAGAVLPRLEELRAKFALAIPCSSDGQPLPPGPATETSVVVHWPDGTVTRIPDTLFPFDAAMAMVRTRYPAARFDLPAVAGDSIVIDFYVSAEAASAAGEIEIEHADMEL